MKFRTVIAGDGNNTGIVVPPEVVEGLGAGKRPKVVVTLGTYTYRNSIAVMGGRFMISVSADTRAKAGIGAGDDVEVDLEVDTAPREVEAPADFAEALISDSSAQQFYDSLSYSKKLRLVLNLDVKNPVVRKERIGKTVLALHEGRA